MWILNNLLCEIMKRGPIPRHVAFIMDGNRRWARKHHMDVPKGHTAGFEKLKEALQWCLDLGVQVVTVYAFSIENFKRNSQEVQALMNLAADKLQELVNEKEGLINRLQVRIQVIGEIGMLPKNVQESIAHSMDMSKHHNRAVLNICFPYTSRHDMLNAVNACINGTVDGTIKPDDVCEEAIDRCLGTAAVMYPDLILRSSQETRLSDFLLWESSHAQLMFARFLWPEMSFWQLCLCLLEYQCNFKYRKERESTINCQTKERLDILKKSIEADRTNQIDEILKCAPPRPHGVPEKLDKSNRLDSMLPAFLFFVVPILIASLINTELHPVKQLAMGLLMGILVSSVLSYIWVSCKRYFEMY